MLDEVMSLIENGKVVPRHKSTVPNIYEIDGQWVIKFKKTLEERKIELGEPVEQDNSEPSLNASDAEE